MDDLATSFRPNKSSNRARCHQQIRDSRIAKVSRVFNSRVFKKGCFLTQRSQRFRFRLVPSVNGVKKREA